jgi:hypothetical protein
MYRNVKALHKEGGFELIKCATDNLHEKDRPLSSESFFDYVADWITLTADALPVFERIIFNFLPVVASDGQNGAVTLCSFL